MTEYEAQAKQFLADCNATMEINFIGRGIPTHWLGETKPHNKYQFTITTPKGKYTSYLCIVPLLKECTMQNRTRRKINETA